MGESSRDYDSKYGIPLKKNLPWLRERKLLPKSGAFGDIYLLTTDSQETVVMKELKESKLEYFEKFLQEAKSFKMFSSSNRNIVQILDFVKMSGENRGFIILKYCELGDLRDHMERLAKKGKRLSEEEVIDICNQIINGLSDLHRCGYLYLDLKPDNIGLSKEGQRICYKLLDFGLVKKKGTVPMGSKIGTSPYRAPEFLPQSKFAGTNPNLDITEQADVFSLGCLLYELVRFQYLYFDIVKDDPVNPSWSFEQFVLALKNRKEEFKFANFPRISTVINNCLKVNPKERWTLQKIQEFLKLEDITPIRPDLNAVFSFRRTNLDFRFIDAFKSMGKTEQDRLNSILEKLHKTQSSLFEGLAKNIKKLQMSATEEIEVDHEQWYIGGLTQNNERSGFGVSYCKTLGRLYFGQYESNKLQGFGMIIFEENSNFAFFESFQLSPEVFIGNFENGQMVNRVTLLQFKENASYSGEIKEYKAHGQGELILHGPKTTERYFGFFESGHFENLSGKLHIDEDGDIQLEYTGTFQMSQFKKGKMELKDTRSDQVFKFDGEWQSRFDGSGEIESADKTLVFKGTWKNLRKHGESCQETSLHKYFYFGGFVDGLWSGFGTVNYFPPLNYKYEGNFLKGQRKGQGCLHYFGHEKIEKIEGLFLNDDELEGKIHYHNQEVYKGSIKDSKKDGKGILNFVQHCKYMRYDGDWKNDLMHGEGSMYFMNGQKYTGELFEGAITGKGTLETLREGIILKGVFKEGLLLEGTALNEVKQTLYTGTFENNLYHGDNCKIEFKNEDTEYIGEFKQGKMQGKGKFIYKDIGSYLGMVTEGQPHGTGVFTTLNYSYNGEFKEGGKTGFGKVTITNSNQVESYGYSYLSASFFKGQVVAGKIEVLLADGSEFEGNMLNRRDELSDRDTKIDFIASFSLEEFELEGKLTRKRNAGKEILSGRFIKGKLHGDNSMIEIPGEKVTKCKMRNGVLQGEASIHFLAAEILIECTFEDNVPKYGKTRYLKSGDEYEGTFNQSLNMCGKGVLSYGSNQKINSMKYTGEFKDKNLHGFGRMDMKGGSYFCGNFVNNRQNGPGTYVEVIQSKVIAVYRSDNFCKYSITGHGEKLDILKGWYMTGLFKNSTFIEGSIFTNVEIPILPEDKPETLFESQPKKTSQTIIYEGTFSSEEISSIDCVVTTPNGSVYKGEIYYQQRTGPAEMVFKDGGKILGTWTNDVLEDSSARYLFGGNKSQLNEIYTGQFENDLPHGYGKIHHSQKKNLIIFQGKFENGKKHGPGIEYPNSKNERPVFFEFGEEKKSSSEMAVRGGVSKNTNSKKSWSLFNLFK